METTANDTTPSGFDSGKSLERLSPEHRDEILNGSAVDPAVAATRGYETLRDTPANRDRLRELAIPRYAWREESAWPGLLIPLYGVTPETNAWQWKPATPQPGANGKSPKYVSPSGRHNAIDVPEFTRKHIGDVDVPLWVTEGIKKVDSLVSRDRAAIGITGVFNWKSRMGASGLWEDVPLKGRRVVIAFDSDTLTKDGVRQAMIRFGAWLKDAKRARPQYLVVPAEVNGVSVKGVDDYFAAGGTLDGLKAAVTDTPPHKDRDARFTDAYMAAEIAAEVFDQRFIWTPGLGWLRWTGKFWKATTEDAAREAVRRHVTRQHLVASKALESGGDRAEVEGWFKLTAAARLSALTELARGIVAVDDDVLDTDRDLLNCQNGIVDLATGKLSAHDADRYMTKITAADYVADAESEDFDRILSAVPDGARGWLQLKVGQAITGYTPKDKRVPILSGDGSNAKSAFVESITSAVGSYYALVPDELLLGTARRDESMTLRGARLAVIAETPKGGKLNGAMVKKVTEREMGGMHLYKSRTTWESTHTLFIATNYKPLVTETDNGTWRRLALVMFPYTFVEREPRPGTNERRADPKLIAKVENGDQAIRRAALRWAVDGARRWYANDQVLPGMPETVAADTDAWRRETDLIMAFWHECLVPAPGHYATTSDLFTHFNQWASSKNHHEPTERTWVPKFEGHDVTRSHGVLRKNRMGQSKKMTLSRPETDTDVFANGSGGLKPMPKEFTGWIGVRFRTDADACPEDTPETDETGQTDAPEKNSGGSVPLPTKSLRVGTSESFISGVRTPPKNPGCPADQRIPGSSSAASTGEASIPKLTGGLGSGCLDSCGKDPFTDVVTHGADCPA